MANSLASQRILGTHNVGLSAARSKNVAQRGPSFVSPMNLRRCQCLQKKAFLAGSSLRIPPSQRRQNGKDGALPSSGIQCGLLDYVGRDLLRFDTGKWGEDVEKHGAMAVYMPLEGGPEGRYVLKLKNEGYNILNLNARGLGDPEAYLMKVHGVRPAHYGKEPIATFYMPPEIDYRLSLLPPDSKGLVLWLTDGKVLSRAELQYLILIPVLRPKVRVVVELGGARQVEWYPLKEIVGLPPPSATISSKEVAAKE